MILSWRAGGCCDSTVPDRLKWDAVAGRAPGVARCNWGCRCPSHALVVPRHRVKVPRGLDRPDESGTFGPEPTSSVSTPVRGQIERLPLIALVAEVVTHRLRTVAGMACGRRIVLSMATDTFASASRRILAEWPILAVVAGVGFATLLVVGNHLFTGMAVMGLSLLGAAGLRLFLTTRGAGTLAIRRRAIDVTGYGLLGIALIVLGVLVEGVFGSP
jgi:hypothetical protein